MPNNSKNRNEMDCEVYDEFPSTEVSEHDRPILSRNRLYSVIVPSTSATTSLTFGVVSNPAHHDSYISRV